jgi:radical SAM protein with 4Fe4S-binding SPASM domain
MKPIAERKQENSRLLREDFAQGRETFRAWPEIVSLHTTERCNLRCIMCPRSERIGRSALARDVLRRVCETLFPTARKAIVTGHQGEPMLTDFDVVVDAAMRHGVRLDLVTNGTLLTGDRYAQLAPALGHLNVSVDSHQPEVYERIRAGGRFEHLQRNLREISALRRNAATPPLWTLSAVVMRCNLDHLGGLIGFAADLGADAVILQPLRQYVRRLADEDVIGGGAADLHSGQSSGCPDPFHGRADARARLDARFDELRAVARARRINLYFADFQLPAVEVEPLRQQIDYLADSSKMCWYLMRNVSIYDTGMVYPCCHPTDYSLGDVRKHDIQRIWNGPAMQRLRRAHFTRRGTLFCSGCLHAPYLETPKKSRVRDQVKFARLVVNHVRHAWSRRRNAARAPAEPADQSE